MVRWTVHGERLIYDSDWVRLALVDVEVPGGARFDHHVVRAPHHAAGVVVHDRDRGVLLLWRHRFITDTWGWEIPAGRVDDGESVEAAAGRETVEETGWRPGPLEPLIAYHPMNGVCDQVFHTFVARRAEHVGDPVDPSESERVEWLPLDGVRRAMSGGEIHDGLTLTALSFALATGRLEDHAG